MSFRKCPKCGCIPDEYIEECLTVITYQTDENGAPDLLNAVGGQHYEPFLVRAECKNKHVWKLRGIRQITELLN